MFKKLSFLLLGATIFLSSCSETPFVGNVDNNLLVGSWNIDEVDNADALVSAEQLMNSIINEKFQANNSLNFSEGANFTLMTVEKAETKGEYSIGADDKSLRLKIEGIVYDYELIKKGDNSFAVNSMTAGETVKLVISKK